MARKKVNATADVKLDLEIPEKINPYRNTDIAYQSEDIIVFQAKCPLSESKSKLLQDWATVEMERTGIKIFIAPFSVDVKVGEQ